jgi:hypothetical protein
MKTDEITNTQDVIDSRDVIARIEELESDQESLLHGEAHVEDLNDEQRAIFQTWEDEYGAELDALRALAEEASGSPDWEYGEQLIRDAYFEEYARELADDIGAVQKGATWPNNFIDWPAAAEALKADYTSVSFDGEDYWIRS